MYEFTTRMPNDRNLKSRLDTLHTMHSQCWPWKCGMDSSGECACRFESVSPYHLPSKNDGASQSGSK